MTLSKFLQFSGLHFSHLWNGDNEIVSASEFIVNIQWGDAWNTFITMSSTYSAFSRGWVWLLDSNHNEPPFPWLPRAHKHVTESNMAERLFILGSLPLTNLISQHSPLWIQHSRDVENRSGPQKSCVLSNSQALGHVLPFLGILCQYLLVIHTLVTSH